LIKVSFLDPVQGLIYRVDARMRSQADDTHPELAAALDHLLSSGGKRIRVAAALLSGLLISADRDKLVTLAAAIEMLHTATLVHDDLIDGSLLRRGIPTLNAQWTPAATVLTGDFIFARAAKLASETDSVAVMRLYADTLAIIVSGEIRQLFGKRMVASRTDYEKRIYAKTASLFETATTSAGILAGAGEDSIARLRKFGYEIGMAFQIVDDVLDFTGEQATVGKPVGSDLRQGLITLPALYYCDNHPDDRDFLALLDGQSPSEVNFERLLEAIRASGAIEESMTDAGRYVQRGIDALSPFPECIEKQSLLELAQYIVARTK
jgi:geranylgeranyl pyrophosphate synthase